MCTPDGSPNIDISSRMMLLALSILVTGQNPTAVSLPCAVTANEIEENKCLPSPTAAVALASLVVQGRK